MREKFTCIDLGTKYCPCHLAESGDCILCSQLMGKCFCDCNNWNGVCVYSEFCNNKNKSKEGRKTYNCEILEFDNFENEILIIKFKATRQFTFDLAMPGAYIFLRKSIQEYFDTPISVMEVNNEEEWVKIVIRVTGVKTKDLITLNKGEKIKVRGPYFNGIFGIKDLCKLKEKKVLILGRGIGIAPIISVLKNLKKGNNEIFLLKDLGEIKYDFATEEIEKYNPIIENGEIIKDGKLTEWAKDKISKYIENGVEHIHIGGADITTYGVISHLDNMGKNEISLSCCNNFKMACGEGVCGACTIKYEGNRVRRYCKYQTDPRTVFKGRWLI